MIVALSLQVGARHTLVCKDTAAGRTHTVLCLHINQAATPKGLEKLSIMCRYPYRLDSDRGHVLKVTIGKIRKTSVTSNGGSIPFISHKQQGWPKRRKMKYRSSRLIY